MGLGFNCIGRIMDINLVDLASLDNQAQHGLFTKHPLEALAMVIITLSIRHPWRKL